MPAPPAELPLPRTAGSAAAALGVARISQRQDGRVPAACGRWRRRRWPPVRLCWRAEEMHGDRPRDIVLPAPATLRAAVPSGV